MNEIAVLGEIKVRITYKDGKPWFVAQDICDALFLSNVSAALKDLDEDEKNLCDIISNNTTSKKARKTQKLLHLSESGVYSLILKSKKPEAMAFRKWVTKEVLPAIRETGSYNLRNRSLNWLENRQKGVDIRKAETEVIQQFVDYAIEQGADAKGAKMYFSIFTKEVYKTLGLENECRDKISGTKLISIHLLELTIRNSLLNCMDKKIHYKEAYKITKERFNECAKLAGFSVIKSLE